MDESVSAFLYPERQSKRTTNNCGGVTGQQEEILEHGGGAEEEAFKARRGKVILSSSELLSCNHLESLPCHRLNSPTQRWAHDGNRTAGKTVEALWRCGARPFQGHFGRPFLAHLLFLVCLLSRAAPRTMLTARSMRS